MDEVWIISQLEAKNYECIKFGLSHNRRHTIAGIPIGALPEEGNPSGDVVTKKAARSMARKTNTIFNQPVFIANQEVVVENQNEAL